MDYLEFWLLERQEGIWNMFVVVHCDSLFAHNVKKTTSMSSFLAVTVAFFYYCVVDLYVIFVHLCNLFGRLQPITYYPSNFEDY